MKGEENLIPLNQRTKEEQREIASKGGKASGAARRKKRDAKAAARLILNLPAQEAIAKNLAAMGIEEVDHTNMVAIMARAFTKAMTGDIGAMQFLIGMSGTSPQFKMEEERHKRAIAADSQASNAVDDWAQAVINAEKKRVNSQDE